MGGWLVLFPVISGMPVLLACWRNRTSALSHAMAWVVVAWLGWTFAHQQATIHGRYFALVMTACAGVAVLGARRPGAAAWHAVVAGLLIVLLMPLAHGFLATDLPVDAMRTIFLGAALGVGIGNYVPTRLGLGAAALLAACLLDLKYINSEMPANVWFLTTALASAAPWLAWFGLFIWAGSNGLVDEKWRDFRDRFGVVWAQRLREQFNNAARNSELDMRLGWRGLYRLDGTAVTIADRAAAAELLAALMSRFM